MEDISQNIELSSLSMFWQMLNKGLYEVKESFSPISALEMLIVRVIYLNDIESPNELVEELSKLVSDQPEEKQKIDNQVTVDPKVKEIIDFFPGTKVENIKE